MNSPASPALSSPLTAEDVAAKISELDELLLALLKNVPISKPWGRHLQSHLRQTENRLQVLRLTLLLKHDAAEISAASVGLRDTIAMMCAAASGGRADVIMRSALRLMRRDAEILVNCLSLPST